MYPSFNFFTFFTEIRVDWYKNDIYDTILLQSYAIYINILI